MKNKLFLIEVHSYYIKEGLMKLNYHFAIING